MITTGEIQSVRRRRGARLWIIAIVGMLALCCGVPAAGAGAWFVWQTAKASPGAQYSSVAVGDFMDLAFNPLRDHQRLVTAVCDRREDAVLAQAAEYRAQLEAHGRQYDEGFQLILGAYKTEETGDRATIRSEVALDWLSRPEPGQIIGPTRRVTGDWRFDLVREGRLSLSPGWKVCGFAAPPVR